jgi:hypothetical protein
MPPLWAGLATKEPAAPLLGAVHAASGPAASLLGAGHAASEPVAPRRARGRPWLRGLCSPRLGAGRTVVERPSCASGPAAVEAAAASRPPPPLPPDLEKEGRWGEGARWLAARGRECGGGSAGRGGVGG